jgi:lipopolysaccharide/colanic/teichoic acid biosynthesis glycosyltransferase
VLNTASIASTRLPSLALRQIGHPQAAIQRAAPYDRSALKRVLDVAIALVALVALLPVFVVVALLVKFDSPGPLLFRQPRVGRQGTLFTCLKFRSMYQDAERRRASLAAANEADGPIFKIRRDPRITRVGRVIRKLSIDELPQLVNVLRGDMSLVGPRPPLPSEVKTYGPREWRRLAVMPGITGLQQVSGRSDLPFDRWVDLDLEFIARQSLRTELVILVKTVPAVLLGKGAY